MTKNSELLAKKRAALAYVKARGLVGNDNALWDVATAYAKNASEQYAIDTYLRRYAGNRNPVVTWTCKAPLVVYRLNAPMVGGRHA